MVSESSIEWHLHYSDNLSHHEGCANGFPGCKIFNTHFMYSLHWKVSSGRCLPTYLVRLSNRMAKLQPRKGGNFLDVNNSFLSKWTNMVLIWDVILWRWLWQSNFVAAIFLVPDRQICVHVLLSMTSPQRTPWKWPFRAHKSESFVERLREWRLQLYEDHDYKAHIVSSRLAHFSISFFISRCLNFFTMSSSLTGPPLFWVLVYVAMFFFSDRRFRKEA